MSVRVVPYTALYFARRRRSHFCACGHGTHHTRGLEYTESIISTTVRNNVHQRPGKARPLPRYTTHPRWSSAFLSSSSSAASSSVPKSRSSATHDDVSAPSRCPDAESGCRLSSRREPALSDQRCVQERACRGREMSLSKLKVAAPALISTTVQLCAEESRVSLRRVRSSCSNTHRKMRNALVKETRFLV